MKRLYLLSLLWLFTTLPLAAPGLAQNPTDYTQAKARADQDEASLSAAAQQSLLQAQQRQLDTSIAQCAHPDHDTSAFVVVVELDARGKIIRSWRQGDTALAVCVEKELNGRFLQPPPRAPFLVAFELSFAP